MKLVVSQAPRVCDTELLKQQIPQDCDDVFESQPPIKGFQNKVADSFCRNPVDRLSNIKKPLQHLPVAEYPFQIISADWFDQNGNKFLVIVD